MEAVLFDLPSQVGLQVGLQVGAQLPSDGEDTAEELAQACVRWLTDPELGWGPRPTSWRSILAMAEHLGRFAAARAAWAREEIAVELAARDDADRALYGEPAAGAGGHAEFVGECTAFLEGVSPSAAGFRVGWSQTLVGRLPVTYTLLAAGRIPESTARLVALECEVLEAEQCAVLEGLLWREGTKTKPSVTGQLVGTVRRRLRRLVPLVQGRSSLAAQREREEVARRDRRVWCEPGPDGTATLGAVLADADAAAVMSALTAYAGPAVQGDPRGVDARRADALVQQVTGNPSFTLWSQTGARCGEGFSGARHWNVEVRVGLDTLVHAGAPHAQPANPAARPAARPPDGSKCSGAAGNRIDVDDSAPGNGRSGPAGPAASGGLPSPQAARPGCSISTIGEVSDATAAVLARQAIDAGGRVARLVTHPLSGRLLDLTLTPRGPGVDPEARTCAAQVSPAPAARQATGVIPDPPPEPPPDQDDGRGLPGSAAPPGATLPGGSASDLAIATVVEEGYRPSRELARFVRSRDGHCQHPGCRVPAQRCHLDHVRPYDHEHPGLGGPTSAVKDNQE
jgi:hypothetical protein